MKFSQTDGTLGLFWGQGRGPEQALEDERQIEATVEAVLRLSQIAMPVLSEVKRMVRPTDGRLEVAQRRVDRLELRQTD